MSRNFIMPMAVMAMCVAASGPAHAQTTTKLTATKANDYGLVYTLPSAVINVTLEAERTESRPGELYNYASKYLKTSTDTERITKMDTCRRRAYTDCCPG